MTDGPSASFVVVVAGSNTSCWVRLNTEAMKTEYQAVRSKRIALGEMD